MPSHMPSGRPTPSQGECDRPEAVIIKRPDGSGPDPREERSKAARQLIQRAPVQDRVVAAAH
jgi:hypothetical protein